MMMDMKTGVVDSLEVLRAEDASSSYHSWSSNGRWIAFASKRGDGMFGRVWMAHVDADGRVAKPFRLPQRDPEHDRLFLRSYNLPDLGDTPVPFDVRDIRRLRNRVAAEMFTSATQP
jgi:Tol biopolymer transport system component